MGLLKRLRASSSANARPELETAPPLPPQTTSRLYASSSRASLSGSEAASSHHLPTANSTPTPAKPSKPFWKRKGKGKEKEVQGFSYESTAPSTFAIDRTQSHLPASARQENGYAPQVRQTQSRPDGAIYENGYGHSYPTPKAGVWDEAGLETPRPPQHTPKGILKPRGMLGKLDFEQDSSTDEEKLDARVTPQQRHSSYSPAGTPPPGQLNGNGVGHGATRPFTTVGYGNLAQGGNAPGQADAGAAPRMSQEEPVEHLISPEKKRLWTPGARRMSRSSEPEEPSSPTPRKSSLPPQELGTPTGPTANRSASSDSHDPQPRSTRRPSSSRRSSFNLFARSTSRVNIDVDSFQLRSFRHVSGASEADFAGWESYDQPEVPKAEPKLASPPVSATLVTSPISAVAPSTSRPTSTAPPSRPVSRATSLASMDDHIAASTKVSAAAFRKGIRRPSEGANTSMDMEDDDDVPLGMLRPGARQSSALSLSSMRDGTRTPGSAVASVTSPVRSPIRQAPKLSPDLPVTPSKAKPSPMPSPSAGTPDRLRPRTTRQPLISPDEIHPIFASPSGSPTGEKPKEVLEDGYFAPSGTPGGQSSRERSPEREKVDDAASPAFDFKSLDYPIDAISTSPQVPKLIKTEATPALGPPVDISPPTSKFGRLSISVPEPKEASKPLGSSNGDKVDEGMDADMIVKSMAMYGAEEESEEPPTPRMAMHQQSHSTLFGTDASSDTTSTIRSPLSERLGNLVGPRPMSSKPSLPKLDTLRLDGENGERVKSPASDSTVSPTVSTIRDFQPAVSSFSRVNGGASRDVKKASPEDSDASSSSEEEGDEEVVPPKRPDGPPRSSFTNAPRPRIPLSNKASASSQSSSALRTSSNDASDSDDEDDDKPLARIKSQASRSTLAVNETSSARAPPKSAKASTAPLPVVAPPLNHSRRASVPAVIGSDTLIPGKPTGNSPTKRIWNASPASSQSGLTGDSSAVQPITPSENDMSEGRAFKAPPTVDNAQQWQDSKRASVSWAPEHRSRRDSHISVATAPPTSAAQMHEQAPPVPSMPGGVNPMDPMMRQRMKEMWQAQYMAAASRAFEDEWERQSNVSGATGSMAPPSVQNSQFSGYPMPASPYGQHPQMGYGFPPQMQMQMQMPSQYMFPNWNMAAAPPPQPSPSMYSYGTGAQSVYGGEFGPPQHMPMSPYNRPMSMAFPRSYSTTNLHQLQPYDLPHHQQHQQAQRPSMPTSRSTSYFQPTGSSSRRERAPADDLDYTPPPAKGLIHSVPNSPRGAGNRRSQLGTSVINANDRSTSAGPPPTSWRRSSAMPLLEWDEEETPRKRRTTGQIVN